MRSENFLQEWHGLLCYMGLLTAVSVSHASYIDLLCLWNVMLAVVFEYSHVGVGGELVS